MRKRERINKKGFTLVELLVVIAIIGILAAIVTLSVSSARAKARDARRKQDLDSIRTAVEIYNNDHSTYKIAGTGSAGTSCGWFNYQGGVYTKTIAQGLLDAGMLGGIVIDPLGKTTGRAYMYYTDGKNYSIYASLERPNSQDKAACDKNVRCVSLRNSYGINYVIGTGY